MPPGQEHVLSDTQVPQLGSSALRAVFKDTSFAAFGELFYLGAGYLAALIMARYLGVSDYGIFSLGLTLTTILAIIARLGLDVTVLRYSASYQERKQNRYLSVVVLFAALLVFLLSFALVGILVFGADAIAIGLFKKPALAAILPVLSLAIPFLGLQAIGLSAVQGVHQTQYRILVEKLVQPALRILLLILAFGIGLHLSGAVMAIVLSFALSTVFAWMYVKRFVQPSISHLTSVVTDPMLAKEWLSFGWPLLLEALLVLLMQNIDILMLGYLRPAGDVGIYAVVVRLGLLVAVPLTGLNMIFAPMISSLHSVGDWRRLENYFKAFTWWVLSLSLPIFVLLAFWGDILLRIFGQEFSAGVFALAVVAVGQLLNVGVGSVGYMLTMTGRPRVNLLNAALMCVLNFGLNLWLIPLWGFLGAAIATSVSLSIINLLRLFEVYSLYNIHPYHKGYVKPVIIALASVIPVTVLSHQIAGDWYVVWPMLFLLVYVSLFSKWALTDGERLWIRQEVLNRVIGR